MEPSKNNLAKPLTFAGIILLIAGIVGLTSMNKGAPADTTNTPAAGTESTTTTTPTPTVSTTRYKDGTYTADGNYISPGGAEKVVVALTVKNEIVVDSVLTIKAERPISVDKQTVFAAEYKQYVIGKKLDDISVGKVSGASLTPKGFNDAVEKIKVQAQS
jgi:uncharacterized protein with FMN-binding domain